MDNIFLDSSVVIAAVLSSTGGSFRLLREAHEGRVRLVVNEYVFNEVERSLRRKYPETVERLQTLTSWCDLEVQPNPPEEVVSEFLSVTHPEDAPVIAGALHASADFLLTLDRKHLLTEKVLQANLPFSVMTPREFFNRQ